MESKGIRGTEQAPRMELIATTEPISSGGKERERAQSRTTYVIAPSADREYRARKQKDSNV